MPFCILFLDESKNLLKSIIPKKFLKYLLFSFQLRNYKNKIWLFYVTRRAQVGTKSPLSISYACQNRTLIF